MDGPEALPPAAGLEVTIPELQHQYHGFGQSAGLEVGRPPLQQRPIHELPPANSNTQSVNPGSAPPPAAGLEVAHPKYAQQIYEFPTTDVNQGNKTPSGSEEHLSRNEGRICGLRRRESWLVLIIILLITVAVVVGTVLGTRKHDASGASATATATVTTASPGLPTSTSSSTPTSIRAKSKLAVTGWRTGQEYSIWLFYQGPDDFLRYSAYESVNGEWATPVISVKAAAGSSIGATAFNHSVHGGDDNMQTQLYYLDSSNYIREQDFSPGITQNGSLSYENYKASPSSGLSTYWPSLIYEGDDGAFHEITYVGNYVTTNVWKNETVSQLGEGVLGSGLAELTTTQNYTSLTLFYQTSNGMLVNRERDSSSNIWSADSIIATIPKGSSIGALSISKITGTNSSVYILWQDTTGDIQVNWLNDANSGWMGPSTYDALKNADNGTSITCLTPVTWYNISMGTGPSLGRCYFQVNSAVREVEVEDGEWKVLGDISIP